MDVIQVATINLIIDKEQRKYQILIPFGAPWEEAFQTIEDFKSALTEMKRLQDEKLAQENKEDKTVEEVEVEVVQ